MIYNNRQEAGQRLAEELLQYKGGENAVVLGLARGGVPVAFEVARSLGLPMDVFLVQKLGVPGHEELAFGAIASGGVRVLNEDVLSQLDISHQEIEHITSKEKRELERREQAYRGGKERVELKGKVGILVDDGLATGASMRAAVTALRRHEPERIVVAVPTAAVETCAALEALVDEMICAETPSPFYGVGAWYKDFSQTTDDEVRALLGGA